LEYGTETWALEETDAGKLKVAQMRLKEFTVLVKFFTFLIQDTNLKKVLRVCCLLPIPIKY
jgi:hypothetical protein